jgi:hypothetical protein
MLKLPAMANPFAFTAEQTDDFQRLLQLDGPFAAPAGTSDLQAWYQAWLAQQPSDADARLGRLAIHDLRMCLQSALDRPLTDLAPDVAIASLLPADGRRRCWEQCAANCEWVLPSMGLPGWAQTLFGCMLLAGLVLPFWLPWWSSLIFPFALALSFFLENRVPYLPYPTFSEMAARMVSLNAPAIHIGKFAAEDLERVFYVLACEACRTELPLDGWADIALSSN